MKIVPMILLIVSFFVGGYYAYNKEIGLAIFWCTLAILNGITVAKNDIVDEIKK